MTNAIIIDLDGTLCNSMHVSAFTDIEGEINWDKWSESTAFATRNEWCAEIVNNFAAQDYHILFLTARHGTSRNKQLTEEWLNNYGFGHLPYTLIMRDENDRRSDYVIKEELYYKEIAPKYRVLFAIDDKHAVIGMWRKLGIPALHCADY